MLEMFRSELELPSIQTRDVCVVYPMAAKPLHKVQIKNVGMKWKQVSLEPRTRILPLECCTKKRDSLEKTNLCRFCNQVFRSNHQSCLLSLYAAMLKTDVLVTVLTVHYAINRVALFKWILGVKQTCPLF
ncbi:hypothetical protein TNCV_2508621 [Trichonephila clavipes]|nr:hypothetical protein TNCV_2508621 [Trichonephila clavipes]